MSPDDLTSQWDRLSGLHTDPTLLPAENKNSVIHLHNLSFVQDIDCMLPDAESHNQ